MKTKFVDTEFADGIYFHLPAQFGQLMHGLRRDARRKKLVHQRRKRAQQAESLRPQSQED